MTGDRQNEPTAPVHPGGERWIVDGGDGCTTEFDTEAEAVAYADACIQDWCDEGWMEEVDNIFVARLTHRSQRQVVAVQGEVSDEEWERVTHGGSGFSEWWDYTIEPLAATPAPVTPPTECVGHVDVNLPHDWCDRCGSFLRATPSETALVPRAEWADFQRVVEHYMRPPVGQHAPESAITSAAVLLVLAAAEVPGDLRPEDAYERSAQRRAVDPSRRSSAT